MWWSRKGVVAVVGGRGERWVVRMVGSRGDGAVGSHGHGGHGHGGPVMVAHGGRAIESESRKLRVLIRVYWMLK